ncbi:MAG: hypothetical protein KDD29_10635, partial [Flavobacteriales bacterium]|nr:hypothetical protein [Flavobacteriales bacterium]
HLIGIYVNKANFEILKILLVNAFILTGIKNTTLANSIIKPKKGCLSLVVSNQRTQEFNLDKVHQIPKLIEEITLSDETLNRLEAEAEQNPDKVIEYFRIKDQMAINLLNIVKSTNLHFFTESILVAFEKYRSDKQNISFSLWDSEHFNASFFGLNGSKTQMSVLDWSIELAELRRAYIDLMGWSETLGKEGRPLEEILMLSLQSIPLSWYENEGEPELNEFQKNRISLLQGWAYQFITQTMPYHFYKSLHWLHMRLLFSEPILEELVKEFGGFEILVAIFNNQVNLPKDIRLKLTPQSKTVIASVISMYFPFDLNLILTLTKFSQWTIFAPIRSSESLLISRIVTRLVERIELYGKHRLSLEEQKLIKELKQTRLLPSENRR